MLSVVACRKAVYTYRHSVVVYRKAVHTYRHGVLSELHGPHVYDVVMVTLEHKKQRS